MKAVVIEEFWYRGVFFGRGEMVDFPLYTYYQVGIEKVKVCDEGKSLTFPPHDKMIRGGWGTK